MIFILTTTIIWVVVLFMILPLYVNVPKKQELGHASSAPIRSHIKAKLLTSIFISMIIALIFLSLS